MLTTSSRTGLKQFNDLITERELEELLLNIAFKCIEENRYFLPKRTPARKKVYNNNNEYAQC